MSETKGWWVSVQDGNAIVLRSDKVPRYACQFPLLDGEDGAWIARYTALNIRREKGKSRFFAHPTESVPAHIMEALNEPYAPWPPE